MTPCEPGASDQSCGPFRMIWRTLPCCRRVARATSFVERFQIRRSRICQPARGQPLEIGELHGINEAGFIRAPREDFVRLVRPEIQLGDNGVGWARRENWSPPTLKMYWRAGEARP